MLVTVIDEIGNILSYEMNDFQTIGELKANISQETKRDPKSFSLTFNERLLISDAPSFSGMGYTVDGIFKMVPAQNLNNMFGNPQPIMPPNNQGINNLMNNPETLLLNQQFKQQIMNEAAQVKSYFTNNPYELNNILEKDPLFGQALLSDDDHELHLYLAKKRIETMKKKQEEQSKINQLNSDAFNTEYQKEIFKKIEEERHNAALDKVYEERPEAMVPTTMLYIPMSIGGNKFQAFVDTGAQSTISSVSFATKVGIMKYVDRRFSGMAKGVGTMKIIGRIHALDINVGEVTITCTISILESSDIDFLLGLDNLKKHRCCVDLLNMEQKFNELGMAVPFLKEHEIQGDSTLTRKNSSLEPSLTRYNSMNQDDKVREFMALTGQDFDKAKEMLIKCNWDQQWAGQEAFNSEFSSQNN